MLFQKCQLRRKSTYFGQPNKGVYELSVLPIHCSGFSVCAQKLGTNRPFVPRRVHDRFSLHLFRFKHYEPLCCRSFLSKKSQISRSNKM